MKSNFNIQEFFALQGTGIRRVLELGAGESTVYLSERYDLTTIEHNPSYVGLVPQAYYLFAPMVPYEDDYFRDAKAWYDVSKIKPYLENRFFDAILVDAPKGSNGRGGFFTNLKLFKTNLYIFDDTHRLWDFRLAGKVADHFGVPFETYTNGGRWFSVVRTGGVI